MMMENHGLADTSEECQLGIPTVVTVNSPHAVVILPGHKKTNGYKQ